MKQALISKIEPRETGYRVAQIVQVDQMFPVAEPDMFWVKVTDDVEQDKFWYDPSNGTFKLIPVPIIPDPVSQPETPI
jgi:hypothetical protein